MEGIRGSGRDHLSGVTLFVTCHHIPLTLVLSQVIVHGDLSKSALTSMKVVVFKLFKVGLRKFFEILNLKKIHILRDFCTIYEEGMHTAYRTTADSCQ